MWLSHFSILTILCCGMCVIKKLKFYICICMCVCVSMCLSICVSMHVSECVHVCKCVYPHPCLLCTGPLECCCGKYSPSDICHTPARATRRSWSSSPAEDGWTPRRTAPGLCMTLFGAFLQVAKQFSFSKHVQPMCFVKVKGQVADLP